MGEAFREQFVRQGVRGKQITVTGHPTHDAVFRRADTVWLVFDTDAAIGVAALNPEQGKTIRSATASGSELYFAWRTLIATSRPITAWRARNTSPKPPAPIRSPRV